MITIVKAAASAMCSPVILASSVVPSGSFSFYRRAKITQEYESTCTQSLLLAPANYGNLWLASSTGTGTCRLRHKKSYKSRIGQKKLLRAALCEIKGKRKNKRGEKTLLPKEQYLLTLHVCSFGGTSRRSNEREWVPSQPAIMF